jgi:hypothetical protein
MSESVSTQSEQFDPTPEGSARRWADEFKAAKEELKKWHDAAEESDRVYRDDNRGHDEGEKLNLHAAGVDLKEATLYGNTPRVCVERRDRDADDDVARVAAQIKERVLNGDLERDEEEFPRAIGLALKDWLLADCGNVWLRLEYEQQTTPAQEAIPGQPKIGPDGQPQIDEQGQPVMVGAAEAVPESTQSIPSEVCSDFVYWKDQLWSPSRVFTDVRWWGKRALMSKRSFEAKFGDEKVPFAIGADPKDNTVPKTPWARVEVWEIWDKEHECLWFYVDGYQRVLVPKGAEANDDGSLPDPLGLSTFWPFPEPLITGATNSKYVPRPSFARVQDQIAAINEDTTRIGLLRQAIDASGVYDGSVGELGDILNSKGQNKMVPAANYKALGEKGGIAACVSWKPLEAIVAAMQSLRDTRRENIELYFQVDGTADIMRGQATEGGATATEQAIKAKYGSIRGDKSQKRFARFCSDAQRIRGEIICKHFPIEAIAERANVQGLPKEDQPLVPQALQLLQSDSARFRVVVKSESVSLTDYAANKQELVDVIGIIGQYLQAIAPIVQGAPMLGPMSMRLLTVFIARVKGGESAEPILDEMVQQLETMAQQAAAQPPQPNPQLQVAQVKAQAEMGKAGAQQQQTSMDMQKSQIEHQMDMAKLDAEVRADALRTALGTSEPQRVQQ